MKTLVALIIVAATAVGAMAVCPNDGPDNNCVVAANGSCANPGATCYDQPGEDCVCSDSVAYTQCQCRSRL